MHQYLAPHSMTQSVRRCTVVNSLLRKSGKHALRLRGSVFQSMQGQLFKYMPVPLWELSPHNLERANDLSLPFRNPGDNCDQAGIKIFEEAVSFLVSSHSPALARHRQMPQVLGRGEGQANVIVLILRDTFFPFAPNMFPLIRPTDTVTVDQEFIYRSQLCHNWLLPWKLRFRKDSKRFVQGASRSACWFQKQKAANCRDQGSRACQFEWLLYPTAVCNLCFFQKYIHNLFMAVAHSQGWNMFVLDSWSVQQTIDCHSERVVLACLH